MNTGGLVHGRYQLQQLVEQGTVCAIYQGNDEVLLRTVAIKVVPVEYIPAYRAAIRTTSQLAHPNITGLLDLTVEPEALYIVQEYVKGDDFSTILRSNPTPAQVIDIGIQICQALIYAGSSSHKICHGDLTPSAIIRRPDGHVHLNNFALPSNMQYFAAWSVVGSDGFVLSDPELPYGQKTEGRRGDDTRAVGLLLYQLLASRPADAAKVEPPKDGRLLFQRNVPRDLCDITARAIMRAHPQRIATVESFYAELKRLAEMLELVQAPQVMSPPVEEIAQFQAFSPTQSPLPPPRPAIPTGQLVSTLPSRELAFNAEATFRDDGSRTTSDAPLVTAAPSPVNDLSMKLVAARPPTYPTLSQTEPRAAKINILTIILMGLVFFAVFFAIGFFIAQIVLQNQ